LEEILKDTLNYGFSIVVAIYLLIRMESKVEDLTKSILKLEKSIVCQDHNNNKE